MNFADWRRRAAVAREVPLESVLIARGAVQDRHDRAKWHTEQGALSISGCKFMSWGQCRGGGKAIDLVMHLAEVDFLSALQWLEQNFALHSLAATPSPKPKSTASQASRRLRLPTPSNRMLERVFSYLTGRRHLDRAVLKPLLAAGRLYADSRGNAVFLLVAGKANRPVGAELRGTGARVWRGMAPGTRKDLGYFWNGAVGSRQLILCESAIDAISCSQIHPDRICISTAGVRANPCWLSGLLARGYEVCCGFDADGPGDAAAEEMIALYPAIKRLRPNAHDWNDMLATRLYSP